MGIPNLTMAPNEIKTLTYDIYTGPKFNAYLRDLNLSYPAISDIMAYGWLVFLSVPMNWLLNLFHGWFGNWGVAIICMTIVVRALIWPLHKKSYMAMKRMSLVQPEMAKLKGKISGRPPEGEHGDDEAVPEIRHQPCQRLRAHAHPDPHLLRLLPRAPVLRGIEGPALLPVDDGPVPARHRRPTCPASR